MAELVTSTTAEELEERLIRRIAGISPSAVKHREARWTPEEGNRERSTSLQTRAFTIYFEPGSDVEEGMTGAADVETEIGLVVVVDYRQIRGEDLGTLVVMDRQDLSDRLCDSWHPVIAGLTRSEYLGDEFVGDEKVQRVAYTFELQYMRRRVTT